METREIGNEESKMWNEFVLVHPKGTYFHLYEWRLAIQKAYHLPTFYLGVFEDNHLVALLPTAVIRRLFGSQIAVSLAFCGYAGWLIKPELNEIVIAKEFLTFLNKHSISSLELRELDSSQSNESEEMTLKLSLPGSSESLWNQLDPKVRNQVRKAEKSGLTIRQGLDQLNELYNIYAINMAYLGTPDLPPINRSKCYIGIKGDRYEQTKTHSRTDYQ